MILKVIIAICVLVGVGLGAGGFWELHQQDTGRKVVVTVHSLRLPIVLFVIGGAMVAFGAWFLWALLTGRGYSKPKTAAAPAAVS